LEKPTPCRGGEEVKIKKGERIPQGEEKTLIIG